MCMENYICSCMHSWCLNITFKRGTFSQVVFYQVKTASWGDWSAARRHKGKYSGYQPWAQGSHRECYTRFLHCWISWRSQKVLKCVCVLSTSSFLFIPSLYSWTFDERSPLFFLKAILSSYFHVNEPLTMDRPSLKISFAGFFSSVLKERFHCICAGGLPRVLK